MTRFWTADLHIGDPSVDQSFQSSQSLLDNYNFMVSQKDEVWFVGDVVVGKFEQNISFMRLFHGTKYLVPGNHDRCHKMHGDWDKWLSYYEEVGFTVLGSEVITTVADQPVKVCHFPYYEKIHKNDYDRFSGNRPSPSVTETVGDDFNLNFNFLIHGHNHGPYRQRNNMIDVGVNPWGGFPVPEYTLEKLITATPNHSNVEGVEWKKNSSTLRADY